MATSRSEERRKYDVKRKENKLNTCYGLKRKVGIVGANFDLSLFSFNLAWFLFLLLPSPLWLLDVFRALFVWSIYFYLLTVPTYFTVNNKIKHKLARTRVSLRMTSCDVARFLGQLRGMIVCVWPHVHEYSPGRNVLFHR